MGRHTALVRAPLAAFMLLLAFVLAGCRTVGSSSASRHWELRFVGNESLGSSALSDVVVDYMVDFETSGFARSVLDDAAFAVESHYRSLGWPKASATYRLEDLDREGLRATIRVVEGKRCELGSVSFRGNTAFRAKELRELVGGHQAGLFGSRTWFVQSEANAAASEITSLYLAAGYLLVHVDEPTVTFRQEGTVADLAYEIREGVRFRITRISFGGEPALSEEELVAALPVQVGDPYSPQMDRRIQAALEEALQTAGHADARVRIVRRADDESGDVDLEVRVQAGPRVVVKDVRVEGNVRTNESLVRNRLSVEPGEPFTPERERKSFRQLFTTGLFSSIRLDLEGEPDATERTLFVRLEESPAREIFVEPGWGSYELARVKAGYRNKNLLGTGRGFRAEGIASLRHAEFELGVSDPFFLGTQLFADASTTVLRRIEPSFTRISAGFNANVVRHWSSGLETGLAYEFRRSKAENVDVTDAAALAALDDVDISAIEVSVRYDTRDNPLVPTRGNTARFSLQWGDQVLGSQLDFLRARYLQTHYIPLREDTTLGLAFRTGGIVPTHDTKEIPLQERFFNGGESTVRSFRENELGPLDTKGEALGGEAFTVISAELRRKLAGNLSGALFVDTGNVTPNYEDYLDFADFRTAIGVGLRYMLPIGPLRVDGGWNPAPRDGEDRFVIHFSVGMPF